MRKVVCKRLMKTAVEEVTKRLGKPVSTLLRNTQTNALYYNGVRRLYQDLKKSY